MRQFSALLLLLLAHRAHAEPIGGRVVDQNDKPIADATVVTEREGEDLQTQTGVDGRFVLDIEASPTWPDFFGRATALREGFALDGIMLKREGPNELKLGAPTSASGVVRDEAGKPVAGVVVRVALVSGPEMGDNTRFARTFGSWRDKMSATTDANGRWSIGHLPREGKANIAMRDPRFTRTFVQVLLSPEPVEAPALVAKPGATISGRVVDEKGAPRANVTVRAVPEGDYAGNDAISDADGRWVISSLVAGTYNLRINDASEERVVLGPRNITLGIGQKKEVEPIAMSEGSVIEGQALSNGGEPIRGVMIHASIVLPTGKSSGSWNTTSGRDGRYTLRVPPGEVRLELQGQPDAFLRPTGTARNALLKVAEGETLRRDWVLQKGATLAVQVLGEGDKPLPQVTLSLGGDPERESSFEMPQATTDARGMARFEGLREGSYTPRIEGAWQIVGTSKIPVSENMRETVQLRARVLELPTLGGRVVTPQGEPVVGATVHFTGWRDLGDGGSRSDTQIKAKTDAQGRYEIRGFKPDVKPSVTASKSAHHRANTITITGESGRWNVPDLVLMPLDKTLAGRVVDQNGAPIVGAQVLAPEGDGSEARTDAQGRFSISNLPRGEVSVLAVHNGLLGQSRASTSTNAEVTITPRAVPELKPNDVLRARDVLEEVKSDSRGHKYFARDWLALELAPHDLNLALELAAENGVVGEEQRSHLFYQQATHSPARAMMSLDEQLANTKGVAHKISMLCAIGTRVAKDDPESAREVWQRLEPLLAGREGKVNLDAFASLSLLKFAYAVETPDRAKYLEAAQREAQAMNNTAWSRFMASSLAAYDSPEAEKILRTLTDGQVQALSDSIQAVAPRDIKVAQRWLDWLLSLPTPIKQGSMNDDPKWAFGQASIKVIQVLRATDPVAALALARRVEHPSWRARALAEAARVQPKAQAVVLMREAASFQAPAINDDTPIAIAARALDVDEALGRELLEAHAARAENIPSGPFSSPASYTLPSLGFHLARVDRARARLILERAWARRLDSGTAVVMGSESRTIVLAMAASDMARALEMASTLPFDESFDTRRKLAQYILADDKTRRTMSFERWGRGDTWTPGDEE